MKNTPLILSIAALVLACAAAIYSFTSNHGSKKVSATEGENTEAVAQQGAIVYFNLDRVINEYDMANELRSAVESKVQGISDEVTRRGNKLQKDVNDFQEKIDKGLLTRSTAEIQGQKLQQQQNDFNVYANQKQQEIAEEQQVMLNQIADAIKTFLEKYNAEKKFGLIVSTQGDILSTPVAVGDGALDITDDILNGLNEEYIKDKAKK